jgi:hypothetical protein
MAVGAAGMIMSGMRVVMPRMIMFVIIMVMVFMMRMLISVGMRFAHCKFPLIDVSDADCKYSKY